MNNPEWFQSAIGALPERTTLEVDGAPIEYLAWGQPGRPGLLLLHGSMAHADWWRFIAPFFAADFRVIAPSFSGMGNSGHRPSYSPAVFLREATAVADAAGLFQAAEPPALVAHSAGGGPAVCLAAQQVFSGTILIDSAFQPMPRRRWPLRTHRIYGSEDEAAARYRLMPEQPHSNSYIVDFLARTGLRRHQQGFIWAFDPNLVGQMRSGLAWEALPRLRCPLFLINGARSTVTTPERMAVMLPQLPPGTEIISIPEAYHHVQVDQPIALITMLGALLGRLYERPIA